MYLSKSALRCLLLTMSLDDEKTIVQVPQSLQAHELEKSLQKITVELIAAHKAGNKQVLSFYSNKVGIDQNKLAEHPGKQFMALVQVYHPDRLQSFLDQIAVCSKNADQQGVEKIARMLSPRASKASIEFDPADMDFGPGYVFRPRDFGFAEDKWEDFDDQVKVRTEAGYRTKKTVSFVEAIRREYFGNLDLQLTRQDLEEIDGELELYDLGIEDLEGIQICRRLEGLNLSCNQIHDINPLRFLRHLVSLDLSSNQIEDADCLERLSRLEELDLSDNFIDNVGFLNEMPKLRCVNLSGNTIKDSSVLETLKQRGVLIL